MKNKIAIVTGGTRGIGKAISNHLHIAGAKVVANYAGNDEAAKNFTDETSITAIKWDVSDFEDCKRGIAEVEEKMGGKVEILINNAGITRDSAIHKMDHTKWDDVIATNLTSCFNMSRIAIDSMREHKFGRIINISSINGQLGQFGQTNYSAAKAGVMGFTKALARETAAKGITVNTIAPGYIATDMVSAMDPDILAHIVKSIPIGRLGDPNEIARAVCFLAADEAAFITGETLSINGGQYME